MRVSYVLNNRKDIRGRIIARIKTIERVFSMKVVSVGIHPKDVEGLNVTHDSISGDELLKMVEDWDGTQESLVLLEFKEIATDE